VQDKTISPALSKKDVNKLQQLTGTLLYYARAVDLTLIMPIIVLASKQSKATEVTADKVIELLKNWSRFHKRQRRSSPSHIIGRIRAPTAPHPNGNRQYHCHMIHKWYN
jgi:hypothetical protein